MLARAADHQFLLPRLAAFFRNRDLERARKVAAGERAGIPGDGGGSARGHQLAAQASRAGTQVDDVIGLLDGFGVVLHHQHRVAHVAELLERVEKPAVVARMEADRGLVEHIEHAAQLGADLRGQPYALRLSARQRGRRALQAQVVQPHRREKLQPPPDFIQHPAGDLRLAVVEFPAAHGYQRAGDRQRRELRDGKVLHAHGQAGGPQPLAPAGRTFHRRHVLREPLAIGLRGLLVKLAQGPQNPLEPGAAFEQQRARRFGKLLERFLQVDARPLREFLEPLLHRPGIGARTETAVEQRLGGVHHHLGRVESPRAAQPVAFLAGAVGAVERKRARLQLRNAGAALGAGQFLRIQPLLAVHHRDQHQPVGQLGGGVDRGLQALFDSRLHQQPVYHHFDGVIPALVEHDVFVE